MGVAIAVLAFLVSLAGLAFSVFTFLARNRPYVGVESIEVQPPISDKVDLVMEVENVGEVPAVDIRIEVKDQGESIEEPSVNVGALFPRQSRTFRVSAPIFFTHLGSKGLSYLEPPDAEGRELLVGEFPEGEDAVLVSCRVTYRRPLFLGFIPERTYETNTHFRVSQNGNIEPARSQISTIT